MSFAYIAFIFLSLIIFLDRLLSGVFNTCFLHCKYTNNICNVQMFGKQNAEFGKLF